MAVWHSPAAERDVERLVRRPVSEAAAIQELYGGTRLKIAINVHLKAKSRTRKPPNRCL